MGRFQSWDQFKESCLVYPKTLRPVRRPANRAVRLLFLHQQLEHNRRSPFLRQIIPPRYSREPLVFLESLERLLPALHCLAAIRSRLPDFSRERLADLEGLFSRYTAFLARSQLYEPNYEQPAFSPKGRTHILFFPELIEDFEEFERLLSGRVDLIPVPAEVRKQTSVRVYETLPEEIRAAILRLAALLDRGVDPDEIVLTVGDIDSLEPLLRQEADLFSLPLQIHLGRPLSAFPPVQMLHKAYSAAESNFSLEAMKSLTLCRSIPWKEEERCRALIRLGLDARIPGNTGSADNWIASIEATRRKGNPRRLPLSRLSGFYSALKDHLLQIAAAPTFTGLKSCLVSFVSYYLDLDCLEEEERRIYQFAVDTLDELEEAEELVSAGGKSRRDSVFPIWWLYLGERRYVPGRYGPGISVFPFRVSEGMMPGHHFVINASQAATAHTVRRYPFLKLHEEQGLSEVQRELSGSHLRLYSHSGDKVLFSYAHRDFQRSNLPPPLFLAHGVDAESLSIPDPLDPFELERSAWTDGTPFPLQTIQKSGYESATVGALTVKGLDGSRQALQDRRLIRTLRERLQDEKGRFRISATALERFSSCAFQFLLERLLRVREEEYQPAMIDPIDIGILLHRGAERFFSWVLAEARPPGRLAADRKVEYGRRLQEMVGEICSEYCRNNPALLAPIAAEIQRRIQGLIGAFLDVELEMMGDEQVEGTEVPLRALAPEIDTVLVGTIDRLGRNPSGYTLIDYKKNTVPARGDLFSKEPVSMQMPFYVHLLEQNDRSVTRAAYYSFENKRYHFVFGGPRTNMGGQEDVRTSIEEVKRRIVEMRERIAEGDFRIQTPTTANCSRCRLGVICRLGYRLEG